MSEAAELSMSIAASVAAARKERAMSVAQLASASGVSRAMIAKVERGEAQPTAVLLGRLSGALGLTLSQLVARAEGSGERFRPREAQPVWTDPQTGYTRRAVTAAGGPIEVVEVELPSAASVEYSPEAYFRHHVLWCLDGRLDVTEGTAIHEMSPGDSLTLGAPSRCIYRNPTDRVVRYAVMLSPRS